jgi:cytosine/adenosine deaminase-related metal-dependent hydrolase
LPTASGWLYTPEGFEKGAVRFQDGTITEVSRKATGDVLSKGLILPGFVNAHTHLGDAVVLEEPRGSLEEVVAPPDGLKFRRLKEASQEELTAAIRGALRRMLRAGTTASLDFREGGRRGLTALRDAASDLPVEVVALGRPPGLDYDPDEVAALLEIADGVGVSSVADWESGPLKQLARHVKASGLPFALHASEVFREDIDRVLDLHPDFLVHMTAGRRSDWERCAEEDIPVALTPRSQMFFGRVPDIPGMRDAGLRLMLGTDNAMFAHPSLLREMEFAYQVAKLQGGVPPEAILAMAYEAANLLTGPSRMAIQEGAPCNFLVLDLPWGGDAAYRVIKATEADIALLAVGPRTWDRERGWLPED